MALLVTVAADFWLIAEITFPPRLFYSMAKKPCSSHVRLDRFAALGNGDVQDVQDGDDAEGGEPAQPDVDDVSDNESTISTDEQCDKVPAKQMSQKDCIPKNWRQVSRRHV